MTVQTLSRNNRVKYFRKYVWHKYPGLRCPVSEQKLVTIKKKLKKEK